MKFLLDHHVIGFIDWSNWGLFTWPNQDDQMNMTEIGMLVLPMYNIFLTTFAGLYFRQ